VRIYTGPSAPRPAPKNKPQDLRLSAGGGGEGRKDVRPPPSLPAGSRANVAASPAPPTSVDVVAAAGEGEGDTKLRAWLRGLHAEIRTAARGGGARGQRRPLTGWPAGRRFIAPARCVSPGFVSLRPSPV